MKKIKIFILLIVIFCSVFLVTNTYSKYKEKVNGSTNLKIAGWNIVINNESIKNKRNLTNEITPVFIGNENTNSNVLAPGIEGYYDINIDCSDVDVSFSYKIEIENNSDLRDLIITGYSINNGTTETYIDKIENEVSYNASSENIRVYIKWDDNGTMTNEEDTEIANEESIALTNKINLTQIRGD